MADINVKTVVTKKEGILSSVVDEETVLLCIENSKYYGIDPVGTSIWELLDKPQRIGDIIVSLQESYDVSAEQCIRDVHDFIHQLIDKNLVHIKSE